MTYFGLGLEILAWWRVTMVWVNVDGCGGRISGVIICGVTVVSGGVISGVVKDEIILDGEREFPV
jgi:hypothetical protein